MRPLRLCRAQALLALAYAVTLGGFLWIIQRQEAAVRQLLVLARYEKTLQASALDCRGVLEALGRGNLPKAKAEAAKASQGLGRNSLYARSLGEEADARDLASLRRLLGSSRRLLLKMERLQSRGRGREADALYEASLRPLLERHLASAVDHRLKRDYQRHLESVRKTRGWVRASSLALGALGVLSLLVFWLWTRRLMGYLARNLERLRRAMAALGSGNFAAAFSPEQPDELGALSHDFSRMSKRLEERQGLALQEERRSALGELAGRSAHVLNNPLASAIGHAGLLLEQGGLSPQAERDLRTVLREAERCHSVLLNMRDFASPNGRPKRAAQLNEAIRKAAGQIQYALERKGISLALDLQGDLPPLQASPRQLAEVFYNLLANACQAIPGQGLIRVTSRRDGEALRAAVEDNGEGIAPENLRRVFEPFFTTRNPAEAAGLGLSAALAVVREHGGSIQVHSEPGRGSRFEVLLPLGGPGALEPQRPRLLVVDDEPSILSLLDRVLKREGFEVECVPDARKALAAIGLKSFDLVLSDLCMPGLDGRGLYEEISRLEPRLAGQFLFATGEIVSRDFRTFTERRGIPVLLKPFDLEELLGTLRERLVAPA